MSQRLSYGGAEEADGYGGSSVFDEPAGLSPLAPDARLPRPSGEEEELAVGPTSSKPLAHALEALLQPQTENEEWLMQRVDELCVQRRICPDVCWSLEPRRWGTGRTGGRRWCSRWRTS